MFSVVETKTLSALKIMCDDETPALVIDNGSENMKAGFAGDMMHQEPYFLQLSANQNTL